MRADSPVPVADRSSRPGATTTAFFDTRPMPCHGSRDLDDAHAGDVRRSRDARPGSCSRAAARISSPTRDRSRASAGVELEAERLGVRDRVPHAAVRHVDRQRPEALDLERRVEPVGKARHVLELDPLDLAVSAAGRDVDRAAGRLQAERRHRLDHLDHARLEQHRRDADRVRAGHRGVFGRLHDHVAERAVRARRGQDHVRVDRDAPARLVKEQAADRVVRPERLHLLEDRRARRRLDPGDHDVPDLAARVAADDRQHGTGGLPADRVERIRRRGHESDDGGRLAAHACHGAVRPGRGRHAPPRGQHPPRAMARARAAATTFASSPRRCPTRRTPATSAGGRDRRATCGDVGRAGPDRWPLVRRLDRAEDALGIAGAGPVQRAVPRLDALVGARGLVRRVRGHRRLRRSPPGGPDLLLPLHRRPGGAVQPPRHLPQAHLPRATSARIPGARALVRATACRSSSTTSGASRGRSDASDNRDEIRVSSRRRPR